jgi:predicted nucleic acid-binding protein
MKLLIPSALRHLSSAVNPSSRQKPVTRIATRPDQAANGARPAAAQPAATVSLKVSPLNRLLLDTNVLIRHAAGELPAHVQELIKEAILYQSAICISEICIGLSHRNVSHSNGREECAYWHDEFAAFQPSRILLPDEEIWLQAGILAGTSSRIQHYQRAQMKDALNDAALYLTSAKYGVALLTENRVDFDFIQQLVKGGKFYWF